MGKILLPWVREGKQNLTAAWSHGRPQTQGEQNEDQAVQWSSPQLSSLAKPKSPGAWCQDFCRSQKWNENQALIKDLIHRKGLGMESQKP